MLIINPGPHNPVLIVETGQTVALGEAVEVPAELGAQLVVQGWITPADKPASNKVADITSWVDGDPTRAALALDTERAKAQPRASLLAALEQVLADAGTADDPNPAAPATNTSEED